jgi:hypothetical protein
VSSTTSRIYPSNTPPRVYHENHFAVINAHTAGEIEPVAIRRVNKSTYDCMALCVTLTIVLHTPLYILPVKAIIESPFCSASEGQPLTYDITPVMRNRDLLDLRQALSVEDLVDRRGCLRPDAIDFH